MFIRSKRVKGSIYYQVVEGYRDTAGRVRHRTVASLGQSECIEDAIAEAQRVLAHFARRLKKFTALAIGFPPGAEPASVRREVARCQFRLTQQQARVVMLREAAKRFYG